MWCHQFVMETILLPRDLVRVVTLRDMTRSMTAPLVSKKIMATFKNYEDD